MSLSPRVSVPRAVLRLSPTSIGPYESSEAIILRCSHTKRIKIENESGRNAMYMERHRPRSIPITEGPTLFWALGRATQAYQARPNPLGLGCTACWDH